MSDQRGFTRGELLIIVVLLCFGVLLLASLAVPHWPRIGPSKEQLVKDNIKVIHTALMRYAADHDGQFPRYIWGGDTEGWDAFYREGPRPGTETAIHDPLIRYGYVNSYPRNPFERDGKLVVERTSAFKKKGTLEYYGMGDPRFGFRGTIMGNGLSDPRYPECDDTLGGAVNGEWGHGSSPTIKRKPGRTWTMGGWWDEKKGRTVSTHWPGNFFYRSAGEHALDVSLTTSDIARHAHHNSADWTGDAALIVNFGKPDKYLLGGYGAERTVGYDALRMGNFETGEGGFAFRGAHGTDPIRFYRISEDASEGSPEHPIMFPEIFGRGGKLRDRGDALNFPLWPYWSSATEEFLFSSPDGSPDGVIITLTSDSPEEKAGP